jgi:uncharacterized membrane protein (UPF0127 family)
MRLLVDGVDVSACTVASSSLQKMKGLLGRSGLDGALYFPDVPSVHTFFMQFTLDIAFLDKNNVVQFTQTMKPWRVSGKHNGIKHVLEAQAGAFEAWSLKVGSHIEVRS